MAEMSEFEFMASDQLAGFRLHRLEVFNWGTFDSRVWVLHPEGQNALLTGDIGSGKSTLVDAVTTLLVPSQRITYNKAAGAENRERTLRSYVLGYYKSERQENLGSAKPVPLRNFNNYSVILGVFTNAGYGKTITLAQVFHMTDSQSQPKRFYVTAEKDLAIARDFSHFGNEINGLRKQLRKADVELFDSFSKYGAWFRRRFGNLSEQALELFHQTVSLKSVGNLTEFVCNHMLEPFDVATRIEALIHHFDDLNQSHKAVLKARNQMKALIPLVEEVKQHGERIRESKMLGSCRDALRPWFASQKVELLDKRLAKLDEELNRHQDRIQGLEERRDELKASERGYHLAIAKNGGDRLERIAEDIRRLEKERDNKQGSANRYAELAVPLGMQAADDDSVFVVQRNQFDELREELANNETEIGNQVTDLEVELRARRQQQTENESEINSLKARRSNIGEKYISSRHRLCAALGFPEENFPFVGELLQVQEDQTIWEGAIERVLYGFGLSLLVPDDHYEKVSAWVDKTDLRGRLRYFRVRDRTDKGLPALHPMSLVRKVMVKQDSPHYSWLEQELTRRYDLVCCETMEQFRRETMAVTRKGQVKVKGGRHEKDDRHPLTDRARYVLGWSNEAKITALEKLARELQEEIECLNTELSEKVVRQTSLKEKRDKLSKLDEYRSFSEIDWQSVANAIADLAKEKQQLEFASDILKTLNEKLKEAKTQLAEIEAQLVARRNDQSRTEQKRESAVSQRQVASDVYAGRTTEQEERFGDLETLREESDSSKMKLTVESCDNRERDLRDSLQRSIDSSNGKANRLSEAIIARMSQYKAEWPLDTQEVDAHLGASDEYRQMLDNLQADDLPRFETRFKELLNENTIREVANFQSQLHKERAEIRGRIGKINDSLAHIDYNEGRYIRLEAQNAPDMEIKDFIKDLRTCTEGALTGSEDQQYSEAKFQQVQRIIERFRGREGYVDSDKRWTAKVTDVRNAFVFAASERSREDDSEYEHYADSGGKSGGQKEKLAYTVLAASLAYQFGLEFGEVRSCSFRFVAIDEAFGRGSDESTQYGLRLFEKLNLQLLIVTPLQKIHVIDPFVYSVGYVHNANGEASTLRNLSIEEYRKEKQKAKEEA